MALADVSETYGIPLDALHGMVGAGIEIPPDTVLKDLEKLVPGTEVWALRGAVAAYLEGRGCLMRGNKLQRKLPGPPQLPPRFVSSQLWFQLSLPRPQLSRL